MLSEKNENITPKKSLKSFWCAIMGFFLQYFWNRVGEPVSKGSPPRSTNVVIWCQNSFILCNVQHSHYCSSSLHYPHFIVKTRYMHMFFRTNFIISKYVEIDKVYISGGPKKGAQLLVGHNFKTARKNSTKLHTTFFQHVFNHYVNFQMFFVQTVS